MLEDNRLKVFKAVAEEGNFTRAARSLGITQPAVSQCIAELERETGNVLFERSRSAVRLTAAGETFLRYAELVLRGYGALNAVCGAGGRLSPGKSVTVSAPSFVQEYILPDLLSDIRTAAAAVFDIREEAEEADVVFSLAPVSGMLDFEGGAARLHLRTCWSGLLTARFSPRRKRRVYHSRRTALAPFWQSCAAVRAPWRSCRSRLSLRG